MAFFAAEIEKIETQEEPLVLSNSDLSEELKSPDHERFENEPRGIEKRTENTSEGATTEIEIVKNVIAEKGFRNGAVGLV